MGNPGRKLTFGFLTIVYDEGPCRWQLEDLHKSVGVELRQEWSSDLITNGSFVLAEGEVAHDRFIIERLRVPQALSREAVFSRDRVPAQLFGGTLTEDQTSLLRKFEDQTPGANDPYVVLSECHLDNARVVEKLAEIFQTYESSMPPAVYVFMGSFRSVPFSPTAEGIHSYQEGFERLKLLLRGLPRHAERGTRYIIVPGPQDPGGLMLPRAPLAAYLTANIQGEVRGVEMASNPCRVRHFSHELIFFRHDVLRFLRRHEAVPLRGPGGETQPSQKHIQEQMVRLLLDQAHLVPLPLEESNVMWSLDHTMHLHPLPDAIFLGGATQAFDCTLAGCNFVSVGAFSKEFGFYEYAPASREVQDNRVPDRGA